MTGPFGRVALDPVRRSGRTMMGGGIGQALAFQAAGGDAGWHGTGRGAVPADPGREPAAEREWELTGGQVALAVLLIVAACEVIGLLA